MKNLHFRLFLCCLILISCNKSNNSENCEPPIDWNHLIIETRSQSIIIDKYEDYGVRDTCDFKEIQTDENHIYYEPINRGQDYFDISEQNKDSIFACIYDIVTNPVYTEQYATCYAGNISIGFRSGNTTLICKYNSVGDWHTISPQTEKLYSLLNRITKIPR